MKTKLCLFAIVFLGLVSIAGCAATRPPAVGSGRLPLNEGVNDLSFLSSDEAEVIETANSRRGEGVAPGTLRPLRLSKGLSLAARERAEELARSKGSVFTEEEERQRLFERVGRFGTYKGSVAEMSSHGYPPGAEVVAAIMRDDSAKASQSVAYLMDADFTVAGVGCTPSGSPGPICVIVLASGFSEGR